MTASAVLRVLGFLLALASVFYLGTLVVAHALPLGESLLRPAFLSAITAGAVLYSLNQFLLSTAWARFLAWAGENRLSRPRAHSIYGRTQIAKYLPGNIFHLAGRHVVARGEGVGHAALVLASLYEILGLLFAAGVIGAAGLLFFGPGALALHPGYLAVMVSLSLLLLATASFAIPWIAVRRGATIQDGGLPGAVLEVMPNYLFYLFFFLVTGLLVVLVAGTVIDLTAVTANRIITVFCLAWVAGYLVPGAAGGLGVREGAMVLMLTPVMGEPSAVAIALGSRVFTSLGDLGFFLLADDRLMGLAFGGSSSRGTD